jgi:hypothetical protein
VPAAQAPNDTRIKCAGRARQTSAPGPKPWPALRRFHPVVRPKRHHDSDLPARAMMLAQPQKKRSAGRRQAVDVQEQAAGARPGVQCLEQSSPAENGMSRGHTDRRPSGEAERPLIETGRPLRSPETAPVGRGEGPGARERSPPPARLAALRAGRTCQGPARGPLVLDGMDVPAARQCVQCDDARNTQVVAPYGLTKEGKARGAGAPDLPPARKHGPPCVAFTQLLGQPTASKRRTRHTAELGKANQPTMFPPFPRN